MRHTFTLLFSLLYLFAGAQKQWLLAVQQHADSLLLYSIHDEEKVGSLPVGHMPHEVAYDAKTLRCFVTNFGVEDYDTRIGIPGRSVTVIDPFTPRVVTTIVTGFDSVGNMPHGIKVRPGPQQELFVNIERGDSMLVYDLLTYQKVRRFSLPAGTHNFIFSKDGMRLWLMAGRNGVYEINPQNGKVLQHQLFQTPIRGLTFLGNRLLASGRNELFLLSRKSLITEKHFQNLGVGQILYSTVTKDQRFILCPAPYDSTVLVVNATTGAILKRFKTEQTPINIQATARYAFVSHAEGQHITQIDLHTFTIIRNIEAKGTNGLVLISYKRQNKQSHYGLEK